MPLDLNAPGMDQPLSDRPILSPEARHWKHVAEALLDDERAQFAADTVSGIRDTIVRTGRCTEKMQDALTNIQASLREAEDRPRGGRRYEGFRRW